MAASPVSPQESIGTAVAAMQSTPILSLATDVREAQTEGRNPPPMLSVSKQRDFDPVPVAPSPPAVLCSPATAVAAPVSLPAPTGMTTATVLPPTVQQPLPAPEPRADPIVVGRSITASSICTFQPTELPVATPAQASMTRPVALAPQVMMPRPVAVVPQAMMQRPVGAFSYTAPAVAHSLPPSTDRYIPAIGFSPSRARVARDPPADPSLSHLRRPSYPLDPLPAVPQQPSVSTQSNPTLVYIQEAPSPSCMPAVPASISTRDLTRTEAQSTGGVYGPGVTSNPLAAGVTASNPKISTTAAPVQLSAQTAQTVATYNTGPPEPTMRHWHANGSLPAYAAQLPAPEAVGPPSVAPIVSATDLTADYVGPLVESGGAAPVPVASTAAATAIVSSQSMYGSPGVAENASAQPVQATGFAGVFTSSIHPANLVSTQEGLVPGAPGGLLSGTVQYQEVPGGLVLGSQDITAGPLQAGQTMTPGPVAEGAEEERGQLGTDSDAWSDADSALAEPLSQAWHKCSAKPGPVCEGVETNSDAWSDSASSDPGTPVSGNQAAVSISSCYSCQDLLLFLLLCTLLSCNGC